jgi:hypothetical protein
MTKKLLIVDDEFGGKSKKDATKLKRLSSQQTFSIRRPYGKVSEDLNRLAVLGGTSNESEVINDHTGNRRIIPVNVVNFDLVKYRSIDKTELFMELYHEWQMDRTSWFLTSTEIENLNLSTINNHEVMTDEEIVILEKDFSTIDKFNDLNNGVLTSTLQMFIRDNNYVLDSAKEIFEMKMEQHFGSELFINQAHVLTSYIPYNIHTDARGGFGVPSDTYQAAWTFIIPLDTYDSSTILFEQEADEGEENWDDEDLIEKYGWQLHDEDPILFENYLKGIEPLERTRTYSVESIFKWKKGTMFAASRKKFHTSDNFLLRGITEKRAIVMWTTIPK